MNRDWALIFSVNRELTSPYFLCGGGGGGVMVFGIWDLRGYKFRDLGFGVKLFGIWGKYLGFEVDKLKYFV